MAGAIDFNRLGGTTLTYDQYPTTLITAGLILDETGRPREGEGLLREAVRLRARSLPKGHFWLALADSALSACLTKQGRFAEAEPLLLQSYASLKLSQGPNNPRTKRARQRLIEFYEESHRPDKAERYRSGTPPR